MQWCRRPTSCGCRSVSCPPSRRTPCWRYMHAHSSLARVLWLEQYEVRTDDITLIVMYVDSTGTVAGAAAQDAARAPSPADPAHTVSEPTAQHMEHRAAALGVETHSPVMS
jgi:hypothetical protein